jgi:hypothetical protein
MELIEVLGKKIIVASREDVQELKSYHNMYEKGMIGYREYESTGCIHSKRYTELRDRLEYLFDLTNRRNGYKIFF